MRVMENDSVWRVPAGWMLLLMLFLTLAVSCQHPPTSLTDFQNITTVEIQDLIDPAEFGSEYEGGELAQIESDAEGNLYVATKEPCQVLRLSPNGDIIWAINGLESGDEPYVGPWLNLAAAAEGILVIDPGQGLVEHISTDGRSLGHVYLEYAFEVAESTSGEIYAYPNTEGFLVDVVDQRFRISRSLIPLPGTPNQVSASACQLLADRDGGFLALWNPTRTVYRFGPQGERIASFTVDPPDLLENLDERLERVKMHASEQGLSGSITPFIELAKDHEGNLAALYIQELFFDSEGEGNIDEAVQDAVVYRFTPDGEVLDQIIGFGTVARITFAANGDIFGLDPMTNRIYRFRSI